MSLDVGDPIETQAPRPGWPVEECPDCGAPVRWAVLSELFAPSRVESCADDDDEPETDVWLEPEMDYGGADDGGPLRRYRVWRWPWTTAWPVVTLDLLGGWGYRQHACG